jgi:hypothetical protein
VSVGRVTCLAPIWASAQDHGESSTSELLSKRSDVAKPGVLEGVPPGAGILVGVEAEERVEGPGARGTKLDGARDVYAVLADG